MSFFNVRTALFAVLAVALYSAAALAAGNAARGIEPATDAGSCAQLVADTREMLEETELSSATDQAVESLITEAVAQCDAGQFGEATDSVVQARALITQE